MKFEKSDEIYYDFLGSNFYLSLKIFDTSIQKKFILGVIGLGYVGLPIANRFIKEGIKV